MSAASGTLCAAPPAGSITPRGAPVAEPRASSTSASPSPRASAVLQPVSSSATGFRYSTAPEPSVVTTPSAIEASVTSAFSLAADSASASRTRSVTSRTMAIVSGPSAPGTGVREISTGNSVPSPRSAVRPGRVPIIRTVGAAANLSRSAACRFRNRSGMRLSTGRPARAPAETRNSSAARAFASTMVPVASTASTASGDTSSKAWNSVPIRGASMAAPFTIATTSGRSVEGAMNSGARFP